MAIWTRARAGVTDLAGLDGEVDGVQVMTLTARLDVALQVYAAVAVVRDGHPVGVRSGQAHATGGLRSTAWRSPNGR